MRVSRYAVPFLLVATMAVGACGDGDDTATGTTPGEAAPGAQEDEHAGHGSDKEAAFPVDQADITVKVSMRDFAFTGLPPTIKGEKVLFEVSNEGPSEHEMVVFEKDGDDAVRGIEPFAKGKTQMLAAELKPGSYTARCLVKLGNQTHAELGMQTDFTVE